jgi:hypothetical protein
MRTWLCPIVWEYLKQIDYEIAEKVKEKGCRRCKGCLDWACFPRKPRGVESVSEEKRASLCCRRCRKRVTPDSLRFLWKKVYVALIITVEPEQGLAGVCKRTVGRWRRYWTDQLSRESLFLAHFRYRLPIEFKFDLSSMIASFIEHKRIHFLALARFVSPLGCAPWLRFENFRAEDAD